MVAALVVAVAVGQTLTPSTDAQCWVNPLQVSLSELTQAGQVMRRTVDDHCGRRLAAHDIVFTESPRLRLSHGGAFGPLDMPYVPPIVDLPADWELGLQEAAGPVVLVTGAAIFTTVVVQLIRGW